MRNFKDDLEKILKTTKINEIKSFPFGETDSLRATSIDALELSVRSSNGLRRKGVTTIGGIIDNWNNIKNWRGLGITSINEIKSSFYEYYYSTLSSDDVSRFWTRFIEANIGVQI